MAQFIMKGRRQGKQAEIQLRQLAEEMKRGENKMSQFLTDTNGHGTIFSWVGFGAGKTIKIHYENPAKSFTITYSDGSSYTIKTPHPCINAGNDLLITSFEGKSQREIKIEYYRKAELVQTNPDFTVEEVNPVKERLTLKAKDVKSITVTNDEQDVVLKKFK